MKFSELLAEKMRENHETAYRLAKEIGVSQTTVSNWLTGKARPQLAHIGKLEAHYGCPMSVSDNEGQ